MNRRSFLKTTSTADGAAAAGSKLSTLAIGQSAQAGPTFRRPKIILPVPTLEAKFQTVVVSPHKIWSLLCSSNLAEHAGFVRFSRRT